MKKSVIIVSLFLSVILLANFALAAVPIQLPAPAALPAGYGPFAPLADLVKGAINGLGATLSYILGGSGFGDVAFGKFLLFIVLLIVIVKPANRVLGGQTGDTPGALAWVLSIIIGILGIYFLPDQVIAGILLPYSSVGIAATVIVPIAVYAFFLEGFNSKTLRKMGWVLAAVAFIGLAVFRSTDTKFPNFGGVVLLSYGLAAFACFLLFALDGTIHGLYFKIRSEKVQHESAIYGMGNLVAERAQKLNQLQVPGVDINLVKQQLKIIDDRIKVYKKNYF